MKAEANGWKWLRVLVVAAVSSGPVWAGDLVVDGLTVTKQAEIVENLTVRGSLGSAVMHFEFDEAPTNSFVTDQSAFRNVGTLIGTVWTNAGHGDGSSAIYLNGVSSTRISLTNSPMLNNPYVTKALTMTAWINTTNSSGHIIGGYNASAPNYGYSLALGLTGAGKLNLWTGGAAWYGNGATGATDGTWHFVAAVVDGTNYTIYLDENVNAQGVCSTVTSYTGVRAIGNRSDAGSYPFKGTIDDVRVYDRALSSDELAAIREVQPSDTRLIVDEDGVTIRRLVKQGDIEMGVFTNSP